MFSDLRQFDEAKKWAEEYSRTKGDTKQVLTSCRDINLLNFYTALKLASCVIVFLLMQW